MGRISRVASALISIAISVLTILFLYGYLTPLGLSPSSILGPQYANVFSAGGTSPYGALVPGGVVGLILFTVLTRVGSVTRAATSPTMSSPEQMMRRMNFPGMGVAQSTIPDPLPPDITRSQYIVLRSYRQGYKNSKEVSKSLSMAREEVDGDTRALKDNGYLSKDSKLTSKGMNLLGS